MKPYNPLEKENLGKSVTQSLIRSEAIPLGSIQRFSGAGVYAIYYTGNFPDYESLRQHNPSATELHLPIYVGKAIPTGGRKGITDPESSAKGSALFNRLDEHRKSIEQAGKLFTGEHYWVVVKPAFNRTDPGVTVDPWPSGGREFVPKCPSVPNVPLDPAYPLIRP